MIDPARLRGDAAALLPRLIDLRRSLHRTPEPGFSLVRTRDAVLGALQGLDLEIVAGPDDFSSITAVLRGARAGPSVLLRADMDALRVGEETGLPYSSQVEGVSHACGHDLHTAALVGAARLLSARRAEISGSVVLMFEPGEEAGGGARRMIAEGVLAAAGERVVAAYGIHVLPGTAGIFSTRAGALMAGANGLAVRVIGRGGHGSRPHQAVDPVPALAEIVLALQTFATRRFSPFDPVVITVTKLHASDIVNAIPDEATLEATVRTLSAHTTTVLAQELPALVEGIAAAHGCRGEAVFRAVYPVTTNDADAARHALSVLEQTFGADRVEELAHPAMASEDFSYVLDEIPGAFVFLGATPAGTDPEEAEMNHSPRAVFDDGILGDQAAALAALALSHVGSTR
ncbi:M20 metallopeptidase family protein [Microbacterium arabinogalactanolyticum]|uniref:M20 metallopeptidase family protein n=1 Tax=Microbacterium arabinogalactanolyticum TaxID=69365 RepID=UPI002556ECF4|nr:M20 family metallopeptidase [Microbacterium arabinogalactanolyticum]GLC86338.1 amidohydrolase [Microbacterium arabinogalactanolyticum]